MPEICVICDTSMRREKDWLYSCPSCHFQKSTLEPGAGRGVDGLETLRKKNFDLLIEKLSTHIDLKGKRCLEVGCAEGWFLEKLQEAGAAAHALEPSDHADEMRRKGFAVTKGFFPDALAEDTQEGTQEDTQEGAQQYDMIVFNDVFEHIPAPETAIKACQAHLNPGGVLVLNLPNRNGIFYRLATLLDKFGASSAFDRLWQKGFPSPHISYFSDRNMARFVTRFTSLKKAGNFFLPSVTRDGLRQRIKSSHSGFTGNILYAGILAALPVIKYLPQDIMVFVFKNEC